MLREIDNLAEIAGAFGRMVTVRMMKQVVPECKSNDSGDEVMDGVGEGLWTMVLIWENNTSKA